MVIFGYRISHRPFTRFDFFKPLFLILCLTCLWTAASRSGNFADYRFGDSIIPSEAQLQSSGPYVMRFRTTRTGDYVDFISAHDGTTYSLRDGAFFRQKHLSNILKKYEGTPTAYLGLYLGNPVQKVWRVRVRGLELLDYKDALFWYRNHADPSFILKVALINLFLFLCSWLTFTSTRPPRLTAQCRAP